MNYLFYLWMILGIGSFFIMGRYSKGLYMYSAIGAFAGAITAIYVASLTFQLFIAGHMAMIVLLVTETGFRGSSWLVILLAEALFLGFYIL